MADYEICDTCGNIKSYDFINYIRIEGIDKNYEICDLCWSSYHFDEPIKKYELKTNNVHTYSNIYVPNKQCIDSVIKFLNWKLDNLKSEIEMWNNLKNN